MKPSIKQIILTYSPSLFKICLGYSKSFEDAEDLLQDVFVNVWKGLESFRGESNIKTWLYRITVNTCLLKARKKSISTISLNSIDQSAITYNPMQNNTEQFEMLHETILTLSSQDKSIILLYLEGLTHQEISSIAGITSNYVGVKINRIKKILTTKINNND